jgi:hypothetical protein
MTRVYNTHYFETSIEGTDDDTLGIVGSLIAAAPGIFSSIAGLFGGRKAQCQGSREIQACGQQAVEAMNQLLSGLASGIISPQQATAEASKIVSQFNDPSIVYPAKKGDDAAIRQQFIQQLANLQQKVQQAAAAGLQTQENKFYGQTSGINSGALLLVGGGLAAILLLTRRD